MTLRVGLVGAGNMAATHREGWDRAGDDIVAVLARSRADEFATDVGGVAVESIDEMLSMVDVIDICTPTDTHLAYILAAAKAGVAVVCEKPLARNAADAQRAVDACARADVPLLVAHVVRFFPEYTHARDRVVAGDIGEVAVTRLDRSTYLPATASDWFRDRARSGGVIHDLLIHDVDYAGWVAGSVERVYAKLVEARDGADHVVATLRHAGGALTHVQASWAYPSGVFRTSLEIAGSDGLIVQHGAESFVSHVKDSGDTPDIPAPPILGVSPYVLQMQHFSDVIRRGGTSRVSPQSAVAAVAVCDAVAESAATGLAVDVGGSP